MAYNYDNFEMVSQNLRIALLPAGGISNETRGTRALYELPGTGIAAIFFIQDEDADIPVTEEMFSAWHICEYDVFRTAIACGEAVSSARIIPLNEAVRFPEDDACDETDITSDIFVVTAESCTYGASAILYPETKKKLDLLCPYDYWIIPSSVHEVLVVPRQLIPDPEDLLCMNREVNAQALSPDEFLACGVFETDEKYGLRKRC